MPWKRGTLALIALAAIAASVTSIPTAANDRTIGILLRREAADDGYTLLGTMGYGTTYLIDRDGNAVHSWFSNRQTSAVPYLRENGNLIRIAGLGRIEEMTWDGEVVWEFDYVTDDYLLHHDIEVLPNGNVLAIALEYKTAADAIAAGRDPDLVAPEGVLWPDHIIEIEPTGPESGEIVWEWHAWDHLVQDFDPTKENFGVVADHPELIDINYVDSTVDLRDWHHSNSVDYNEEFDQIVISVRHFNEFWVIDHSTTTEEAASHSGGNSGMGGDLLYRWGNPQAYDTGDASDQQLFFQHDAQWIEEGRPGAGNILVFSNGNGRTPTEYSSVHEIAPPVNTFGAYALTPGEAYGPDDSAWSYDGDFFAPFISGSQRLPNGNTLIDDGPSGTIFEVTPNRTIVWRYVNPVTDLGPLRQGSQVPPESNLVFRPLRYSPDYPGLAGRDLSPQGPIEAPKETQPGDVDGDGVVGSPDALLILQYDAGLLLSLPNLGAADVNNDLRVDAIDASLVLQLTAGFIGNLPP